MCIRDSRLDDGSRNQLGEQHHKSSEGNDIVLRLDLAPIDINGIAHGLEGVKTDPQREGQPRMRQGPSEQRVQVVRKEIRVFKEKQHPQINKY